MNDSFLQNLWASHSKALIAGVGLVALAMASVVDVGETEQAVVMRMGDPVRVINRYQPNVDYGQTGAGLSLRIPFFEQLVRIDRRVLAVEMDKQEVISSDQRKLDVDAFARIRIIDPVKMVSTAGSSDRVVEQLEPILTSQLRQQLGAHTFQSLLTPERAAVMGQIRAGLDKETRAYGVQVLDVRIVSADLPAGTPLDAVFARMQAARGQLATAIRAQGHKQETILEANAEAEAARIYADAFNKDPAFYDFYRAMQSYDTTFANPANKSGTTIVLSPDNDYLRQFRSGGKGK
jgi:membrane protease subunit HflC